MCLSCGTSLERIAAESLTLHLFEFVHGKMWRHPNRELQDRVVGKIRYSRVSQEPLNRGASELVIASECHWQTHAGDLARKRTGLPAERRYQMASGSRRDRAPSGAYRQSAQTTPPRRATQT